MNPLFTLGIPSALFIGEMLTGSANATPSLRAAENWCKLHPEFMESGEADEHLISIRECADWLRGLRWADTAIRMPDDKTPGTCSGEFEWTSGIGYTVDITCHLSLAVAKQV